MPRTWVRSGVVITVPTCSRAQVERLASSSAMRMYTSSRGMRSGACASFGRGLISATGSMLTTLYVPNFRNRIHHMSALELLFALLLVCILLSTAGVGALVWGLQRRTDGHAGELADMRSR